MTAPIDIECQECQSLAGNHCTAPIGAKGLRQSLSFHHAQRVDAAFRETAQRRTNPHALREALCEALNRLTKHQTAPDDLSFILTIRETFKL
jgi:hypothetical protein